MFGFNYYYTLLNISQAKILSLYLHTSSSIVITLLFILTETPYYKVMTNIIPVDFLDSWRSLEHKFRKRWMNCMYSHILHGTQYGKNGHQSFKRVFEA